MRTSKATGAITATAMALALVPAGAFALRGNRVHGAHRHGNDSQGCRLKLNAAPRLVQSGESALLYGTLACSGAVSVANQTVTVSEQAAGMPGTGVAGTATTDSAGNYQLTSPALTTDSSFTASAMGASSGRQNVRVAAKVSLSGPPEGAELFTRSGPFVGAKGLRPFLRNRVTFTGTVSPADAGAEVVLQRENATGNEEWHRIGRTQIDPGCASSPTGVCSYSLTHTFGAPGDANIRVVVRPHKMNAPGVSETLSYEISQAQNPALTIESSADPISYGQTVTITGTLSAGAGKALTLLARGRTQSTFTPVASATSGSGGTYSFVPQMPLTSTLYEVTGAGQTSGKLFEGVKYGLTAGVSGSSIQVGQPLTFSGTVTPGNVGHPVYVQQQNLSGIGFKTVEMGTVGAGSTYSIPYTPFATGHRKLRVKVPGDPGNQGVASQAVGVEVTPASSDLLAPEAPGNSNSPAIGQI
jgi:hypothetical protein